MGLFDFFRRGPQPSPAAASPQSDLAEPRCHHYTLAHQALRSVAFEQPAGFLGLLASPVARSFLADLLTSVTEHCQGREARPDFGVEALTIHKFRVGQFPCVVVEMPPPRAVTEAFFVAAVLLADLDREQPAPQEATLRYFTLEKGFVLDGPPRTVLGEWTAEGSHHNYGDGPAPELGPFVRAVEAMLSRAR